MKKFELFSEKLGKTITIMAQSLDGQRDTLRPAIESASNVFVSDKDISKSTLSMMGWCRNGWNNDHGGGW